MSLVAAAAAAVDFVEPVAVAMRSSTGGRAR